MASFRLPFLSRTASERQRQWPVEEADVHCGSFRILAELLLLLEDRKVSDAAVVVLVAGVGNKPA